MNKHFKNTILKATDASSLFQIDIIQRLWSGYGEIVRYGLKDSPINSIIAKHVRLPKQNQHPRGWNTDLSHQRKLKSYQVESAWYRRWSHLCNDQCRTPKCLTVDNHNNEVLIVLEDLNQAGFPIVKNSVSIDEMKTCLAWLANFHATFINHEPDELWPQGTYWHLDTRPDELKALKDQALLKAAVAIDQKLRNSPFQTLVHGDAKLANFCFSPDGKQVAAVDFQYVGGGCGMRDVAYFIGSCLDEAQCQELEAQLLDCYFQHLKQALNTRQKSIDFNALELDWRRLYPVAWTDFHRFLKGWSPGHWKINNYSERLAQQVIAQINAEQ